MMAQLFEMQGVKVCRKKIYIMQYVFFIINSFAIIIELEHELTHSLGKDHRKDLK